MNKINPIAQKLFRFFIYFFAIIGFLFCGVFVAMKLHLTDVRGSIDSRNAFFDQNKETEKRIIEAKKNNPEWMNTKEWETLKNGIIKDQEVIFRVSRETDLPARLIVSSIIPEQLRFFTSNREAFKKYFEPLKVLGTYTQFSYGISGIKMDTAKKIENNLKDKESQFYLGQGFENVLDYTESGDTDTLRLARFTDSHNHYYSYLYTAMFIKEIEAQWERSGYSIKNRPEVYATLFNIGFDRSVPKENPSVGGSTITIDGNDYTFGGLTYDFYYSSELSEIFPIVIK
jgi:hypothetical protein